MPVTDELKSGAGNTPYTANWKREIHQRQRLNQVLFERFCEHLVYFSDVDEFLDPETLRTSLLHSNALAAAGCVTPRHRMYYYSQNCPVRETWAIAVLFRVDSSFFANVRRHKQQLRWRRECPVPGADAGQPVFHGWHFSYAMDTSHVLNKLLSFKGAAGAYERQVNLLPHDQRVRLVESRIRTCTDLFNRWKSNISFQEHAYDGKLPPVPGWPRHELAPTTAAELSANQRLVEEQLPPDTSGLLSNRSGARRHGSVPCTQLEDLAFVKEPCSRYDRQPAQCQRHRVGRTPCAYDAAGSTCRREFNSRCRWEG